MRNNPAIDLASLRQLQVVLKIASRCNIACPGCYFFEGPDQSWRERDKVIRPDTIRELVTFLRDGVTDLPQIASISIDLHGGEPTMQRKQDFDRMCGWVRQELGALVDVDLHIQTNGILLDDDWVQLFAKHRVTCGISLDGPPQYNNHVRPDHQGRGTHERAVRGLRLLQTAHKQGVLEFEPGLLCTINPAFDAKVIHKHFVHELGVRRYELLIPDNSYDMRPVSRPEDLGRFLVDAFKAWHEEDDPSLRVRIHNSLIMRMLGKHTMLFPDRTVPKAICAFTIASDGTLEPDDQLRNTRQWDPLRQPSVSTVTLRAFLRSTVMKELARQVEQLPAECHGCTWQHVCNGGPAQTRYSPEHHFDRPSIWCEGLQMYYFSVFEYLCNNGVTVGALQNALNPNTVGGQ